MQRGGSIAFSSHIHIYRLYTCHKFNIANMLSVIMYYCRVSNIVNVNGGAQQGPATTLGINDPLYREVL